MQHAGNSRLKVAAAAVGVAFALGPVLGTVHLGLVPHELCPEHGEFIEVEQLALSAPASATPEISAGTAALEAHAHHHCEVMARRLSAAAGSRPAPGHDVPGHPAWSVGPGMRICGAQLFRLAPKASPPLPG